MTRVVEVFASIPGGLPTFVTALGIFFLGLLVEVRERGTFVSRIFLILTSTVTVWLLAFSMMYSTHSAAKAFFWAKAAYLGIPFIASAVYTFGLVLLGKWDQKRTWIFVNWAIAAVFSTLLVGTNLLISGLKTYWWGPYPQFTLWVLPFLGFFCLTLLATMRHYWLAYRMEPRDKARRRIRAFMFAFAAGYLGLVDYLASFGMAVYPFGYLAILGFILLAARAIRRYQLVTLTPEFAASKILEAMQGFVLVTDLDGKIRVSNSAVCGLLGYSESALKGVSILDILRSRGEQGISLSELTPLALSTKELFIVGEGGRAVPVSVSASTVRDKNGVEEGTVYIALDLTDLLEAQERVAFQTYHDTLTSLPNRRSLRERIQMSIAHAERHSASFALLLLDLDRLNAINETLGHQIGDEVMTTMSSRVWESTRAEDFVARLDGDEFVVLLHELGGEHEPARVAQRMLDAISKPMLLAGEDHTVTASVGIALFPADGKDLDGLLQSARVAVSRAKELGRNNYQHCSAELTARSMNRMTLEKDLRRAVENGDFLLHFQPQVNLRTGDIAGVEALVRWTHPVRGNVPPGEFIKLAEESRLIIPLGEWVLECAAAQAARWEREGAGVFRMSVNLSPMQFQQGRLVETVERVLSSTGLRPGSLDLEITETAAMKDADATIAMLHQLADLGVNLSIDDFGTGYSSLSYLKRFPIGTVKIDQSFVRDVTSDPDNGAIVSGMIALAHNLDLHVIAEGVETEDEADFLREHACEEMQGYLFSRPLPSVEIERLLRAQTDGQTAGAGIQ
ncbi:MAG TPA: EAL domain-containing protein [Thermoanaerobaculia bacterium]|nr:EAL domain-containing protein [Thermoanaerobaculia bacterium]